MTIIIISTHHFFIYTVEAEVEESSNSENLLGE